MITGRLFSPRKDGGHIFTVIIHDAVSEKNPGTELAARFCDVRAAHFWRVHD
jgi:hypothetical protein